ncbi:hypothetical protein EL22_27875 [Halostagnicola sp. A56]|nr:hypothetical protein EL22_27875 [Halostagnicola sp. A56]
MSNEVSDEHENPSNCETGEDPNQARITLPVPSIEKQTRIGNFLSDLDTNIRQETQQKEKLQDIKHGLMQDLLTGKVRVNTD